MKILAVDWKDKLGDVNKLLKEEVIEKIKQEIYNNETIRTDDEFVDFYSRRDKYLANHYKNTIEKCL